MRFETRFVKYLTDEEFGIIMDYLEARQSPSFKLLIKFMAVLALRVSDATTLKADSLQDNCTHIIYQDYKTKIFHDKQLPRFLTREAQAYFSQYKHRFRNGFLFFPEKSPNEHIKASTVRAFFVDMRRKFGWNQPYYIQKNGKNLYRISPHTLKHYCLHKFYKASGNDLAATKTFSGHLEMKHTIRYIETLESRNNQSLILEKAFESAMT